MPKSERRPIMVERASATLRRKELGRRLRELRTARDIQVQQAAAFLECSPAKVSRIESGARAVSARDVRRLCELYDVPADYVAKLEELVRDSKQSSWWQSFDVDYATYIGLEQAASTISEYQPFVVPGLLQTRGYATALIEALLVDADSEARAERVAARLGRQSLLDQSDPPRLLAFMDEIAFGRVVGDTSVMIQQIEHMIEMSRRPAVHLQLLPMEAGPYEGFPFHFALLEFPHQEISPVAYIEHYNGDLYLERREEITHYRLLLDNLRSVGLSPSHTRARLETVIENLQASKG